LQGALRMICLMYLKQIKASGKTKGDPQRMPSPSGAWPRADPRWDPGCWEGPSAHSQPLIRPGGSEDSGALRTARPLHARRIDLSLPCPSRSPLSRFPSCAGSMAPFIRRRSARAGVAGSAARRRAASLAGEARFAIAVSVPAPEAVGGPRPARWDPRA
jgi:hypothetical protein